MKPRHISPLLSVMFFGHAYADVKVLTDNREHIVLSVNEEYVLGDNDTLTSAKGIVLEQAKKSATDYAGTYVESTLVVDGDKITKEQVKVLSAGFLEVLDSDFRRGINQTGSIVLTGDSKIRLSKKAINDGLAKLKSDPERLAKIEQLKTRNAKLQAQLVELTKKINSSGTTRADLMASRDAILSDLNSNREATKQVFEQGTLFQLAMLDDNEYELALKDIQDNVYGYLKTEMKVTLGKPKIVKNRNGLYDVSIKVGWNIKSQPIKDTLNKYFNSDYNEHTYITNLHYYANVSDNQKQPYTKKLYDYIWENKLAIEVSIGTKVSHIPLIAEDKFVKHDGMEISYSDNKSNIMVDKHATNPIVIKDLTEAELKSATEVNSKVVIVRGRFAYR
ncbi:hypothetical protein [Vibrio mediterranei]|uniref:hypothetical protein n=1 Tax=Vibrio mediterranei TaxID=689 RepID=UPI0040678A22